MVALRVDSSSACLVSRYLNSITMIAKRCNTSSNRTILQSSHRTHKTFKSADLWTTPSTHECQSAAVHPVVIRHRNDFTLQDAGLFRLHRDLASDLKQRPRRCTLILASREGQVHRR
jgi:hypothetical protein